MNIRILYEDNHVLVIEKPVNVPVQEDRSRDKDVLTIVKEYIKVRDNKPGNVYLALVHRLDRPVGGALLLAKTSKGAARLANELRKRAIERKYVAIVRGKVRQKKETLTHYLQKDHRRNIVRAVKKGENNAKKAILTYEKIAHIDGLTLLTVQLETGRPHQIRVQLAEIGTPLYGDQKYGAQVNVPGEQIALWATSLSFKHPTKKETISVSCPPPKKEPWLHFPTFH